MCQCMTTGPAAPPGCSILGGFTAPGIGLSVVQQPATQLLGSCGLGWGSAGWWGAAQEVSGGYTHRGLRWE
jgi:hypothetical protein